jgi:hypothetical protein
MGEIFKQDLGSGDFSKVLVFYREFWNFIKACPKPNDLGINEWQILDCVFTLPKIRDISWFNYGYLKS